MGVLDMIAHPSELLAMLKVKRQMPKMRDVPLNQLAKEVKSREFCYAALNKVSRSFALVIQQLPNELKDPICVFYLVLRGLDSVEDDMKYPLAKKVPLLRSFHEKLYQKDWSITGVGDTEDYRQLMANFGHCIQLFQSVDKKYQEVIADITRRMGEGMAEFAEKKSINTVDEYNLYCHYVAGLVGHGLTGLFATSGLADRNMLNDLDIANSMGLFLQKTNIIRDYLEDLEGQRTWWPKEIWKLYGDKLENLKDQPNSSESLGCLNQLVTDVLELVPDCLDYMSKIRHEKLFRFCAIPQVMAIATLAEVYNNPDVYRKNVKMRKGLTCKIILECSDHDSCLYWFHHFASQMLNKVPVNDPNSQRAKHLLHVIIRATGIKSNPWAIVARPAGSFFMFFSLLAFIISAIQFCAPSIKFGLFGLGCAKACTLAFTFFVLGLSLRSVSSTTSAKPIYTPPPKHATSPPSSPKPRPASPSSPSTSSPPSSPVSPASPSSAKKKKKGKGGKEEQKKEAKDEQKKEKSNGQPEGKAAPQKKQEESISGDKLLSMGEIQKLLLDSFTPLVEEFVDQLKNEYGMPQAALDRIRHVFNYNCSGGKMNRGCLVMATAQILCKEKGLDMASRKHPAIVLGWCIEILQALFLVADDIMDGSSLRRGKPCWYKLPEVQLDAINDTLILESWIYFLLKKHFSTSKQFSHIYTALMELYQEVSLQTQLGQMLDLTGQPQGRKDPEILNRFTEQQYTQIVLYKTAFYSFYLPIASGMLLAGYTSPEQHNIAKKICMELGEKFQIEDDYLDCYGLPEMIGKDGTDIKDHKCTWLVMQALKKMNKEQRKVLEACYGKEDEKCVARVKQLYEELGVKQLYEKQEEDSYNRIVKLMTEAADIISPDVFRHILNKIHKRQS
jgi:farnesyl-diphosphate farnesyltransferase